MEQILMILIAFAISVFCVFIYLLGVRHGKALKSGAEVKLEPRKAIVRSITKHKEHKEIERKQDDFTKQVNELFAYDGRVRRVDK